MEAFLKNLQITWLVCFIIFGVIIFVGYLTNCLLRFDSFLRKYIKCEALANVLFVIVFAFIIALLLTVGEIADVARGGQPWS